MSKAEDFGVELKETIFNADPKIDRKELLEDIFKSYVAKLFEMCMVKNKMPDGRIEFDAMVQIKRSLISEFRACELSEYQMSEEQYGDLFEKTVKEIFDQAALNHQGEDVATRGLQNLELNPKFMKQGGLYLPVSAAR